MLNGDGLRVVLWVAGCTHCCQDCQNPVTWDIRGGIPFDQVAKEEVFAELEKDYISGLTLSGGDPLHPANRQDVAELVGEIRAKYPEKTIWLYTGFVWEVIDALPFMEQIDVVVDGKFDRTLLDVQLKWKGSSNQRVIDVKRTLAEGKVVLHS